ncbi:SDR family oxidoreductase [Oricola sp.]|uniref:SDR family NAD(P)-dependent oxidoreductase n=1 Tax=Oricola sp. TaxID=1979950 RepID=UPI0025DA97BD|nr:SDR family oxidoreductase [Oricola sp.]MCI5077446.1 SDR family oxidoreductase [Oricola sp.]
MTNKVALVTGAGGSIGSHVCEALAKTGFAIAVNDIDPAAAARTVTALTDLGHGARAFTSDISDRGAVDAMVDEIERDFGPLGVLVNNAGVPGPFSLLVDLDDDVWDRTLRVHLTGSFYLIRAAARRMVTRRSGRIVSVASVAGMRGTVGSAEYGAAKAGMMNLTMTAAKELAPYGITANAVAPSMVGTRVNRELAESGSRFISTALEGTPDGELVDPADIAALVAFLCSPAAQRINGVTHPIDGASTLEMATDGYMRRSLAKRSAFLTGMNDDASA